MHRKGLIRSLALLYAISAGGLGVWAAAGYLGTLGTAFAQVKGATNDPSTVAASPSLAPYPTVKRGDVPQIPAMQFALYSPQSGRVIAHSASMDPVPIASTTKLMTSHLVSKFGNLDDITVVSEAAASVNGSLAHLQAGEEITVRNLLYCLLLVSGNDAAHALAEYAGGVLLADPKATPEARLNRFVQAMNDEASRLRMDKTHYLDPAGLDDEGHSNAIDLAKVASLDIADKNLQPIMDTADNTVSDQSGTIVHVLHNSDRLVSDYQYQGSLGGKTGFTPAAGHCLMSSAMRDGHTLIAVVLNTDSSAADASALAAKKLLDWGFSGVTWQ